MKFEIQLPAIAGDVVPLFSIADAMARRDATAGGTKFHEPTFRGRRARYESMLLKHVQDGCLPTCDDDGDAGEPAAIVGQRLARGGVTVLKDAAPSPGTTGHQAESGGAAECGLESLALDVDQTWLVNLFVNLKTLNEWASRMGHEFTVTYEGVRWVDERGLQPPPRTGAATEAGLAPGASAAAATEPAVAGANTEAPAKEPAPTQAAVQGPSEDAAEPARMAEEPLKADRGQRVKRNALIERNRRRWSSIERDLKDASSNGLSAEARAEGTGFWWEGDALKWAEARDKLQAPAATVSLDSVVHRMVG